MRVDPRRGATVEVDERAVVAADRDRLREAFENPFRNANVHGGPDGAIGIGTLPDGSRVYVADDGPGIPDAERDDDSERGYSSADGGAALGLSIVSRIVDAHGWEIDVGASEAGGARFEIGTDSPGRFGD